MSIFTASPTENLNVLPAKKARRTTESTKNKGIAANNPGGIGSHVGRCGGGSPDSCKIYEYNYHAVNVIIALAQMRYSPKIMLCVVIFDALLRYEAQVIRQNL